VALSLKLLGLLAALAALALSARAVMSNDDCLICHSMSDLTETNANGRIISLFVDAKKLAASVHATNSCVTCHVDITEKHPDDNVAALPVNCARCHERVGNNYSEGVHGRAAKTGDLSAATCEDCHGTHDIQPPDSPDSPLSFAHLAETCGQCHDQEARDWSQGIHGKAVAAGVHDAPTCTDCHSEHRIESLTNAPSLRISADICGRCHASERINTKYNLPADRVDTFFESYHGLATKFGGTVAANCSSCHGYHKILPSSDPDSTINKAHLVETCGKCHPGAGEKFAFGRIHVAADGAGDGTDLPATINRRVRQFYLFVIFTTIGMMFIHNALLFRRKVAARLRAAARPVVRMSLAQRWQHFVLAASFIVLALTGFALKFPDSWVARLLGSNEPFRRWTHRVAGVILLLVGAWHLIYLLSSKEGRQLLRDMFPVWKDLADVWQAVRYLAGWSAEKPKIGRFGYAEKMEYWAVVWGTIIMGVTGLMIWFQIDVTRFLPRWAVDVALTIHYYEAVLACLAIVVWHFYHVIFDPDVYPLNPACWDGRVSGEWQQHEHPLDMLPAKPEKTLSNGGGGKADA
jgi:formate dehydrogenase gamma subunit